MTLEQLANLGEIVGTVGVVVSLVYVGVQVRQNTKATRAATHHAIDRLIIDAATAATGDRELTRVWHVGRLGEEELDEIDQAQFGTMVIRGFLCHEDVYHQYRHGWVDKTTWERSARWVRWFLTQPGVKRHWPDIKMFFNQDFQEWAEQQRVLLERGEIDVSGDKVES